MCKQEAGPPALRLAVVEDERLIQLVYRRYFSDKRHEVFFYDNAEAALHAHEREAFDIAIVDWILPGMDGLELCRRMRHLPDGDMVVIVVVTSNDKPEHLDKVLQAGGNDYLQKPIVDEILDIRLTIAEQLVQDNRRRKMAEVELQKSEERHRLLLHAIPDIVYKIDPGGRFTFINNAVRDLGHDPEELIGRHFSEIIEQQDVAAFSRLMALQHRAGKPAGGDKPLKFIDERRTGPRMTRNLQVHLRTRAPQAGSDASASIRIGEIAATGEYDKPLHCKDKKYLGTVGIIKDITERLRAEDALRRAEKRFHAIMQATNDAVIASDAAGKIILWNLGARNIFGYREEEVAGQPLELLMPRRFHKMHRQGFARYLRTGQSSVIGKTVELVGLRKDGTEFPLELSVTTWKAGTEICFSGFVRDVSDRKRLETELLQAQKMESIGRLAAGIAHEINTPIQYVGDNTKFLEESFTEICALLKQYTQLLRESKSMHACGDLVSTIEAAQDDMDLAFLEEEIPKAIAQSIVGVNRVAKIVKAMKEFSHPGGEKMQMVDIRKALQSTITVARNEWKYVADVETRFSSDLTHVLCYPGEINQVILNLLVNAAQAIEEKLGKIGEEKGKITISTEENNGYAEIRIADTGAGIPPEARDKIFDPFFTTKEVGKGSGQGLAIAHSIIVGKHKGTIRFETEQGKGTVFILQLPLMTEETEGA